MLFNRAATPLREAATSRRPPRVQEPPWIELLGRVRANVSIEQTARLSATPLPGLFQALGGFATAGTAYLDSGGVEHGDGNGAGEGLVIGVQCDFAFDDVGASEGSIRIEAKELKEALELPSSPAPPGAQGRTMACWRLVVRIRESAAGLEHVQSDKGAQRRAMAVGDGHLRLPDALDALSAGATIPPIFPSHSLLLNKGRFRRSRAGRREVPLESSHHGKQRDCRYSLSECQAHTAPGVLCSRPMRCVPGSLRPRGAHSL